MSRPTPLPVPVLGCYACGARVELGPQPSRSGDTLARRIFPSVASRPPLPWKEGMMRSMIIPVAVGVAVMLAGAVNAQEKPAQHRVIVSWHEGPEDIYVVNADGSLGTRLTQSPEGRGSWVPNFSPDCRRIVFASNMDDGGLANIYVMNADGSERRRLTAHDGYDYQPVFSPDGSHVFFLRTVDERQNVWVMNDDGSGQRRLLNSAQESLFFLDPWSPDGSGFVFLATPPSAPKVRIQPVVQIAGADLYVASSDGTKVRRLTTVHDARMGNGVGVWSKDGSSIAFMSDRDGNWEVWVMDANGQHQRQLTHTDGVAVNTPAAWSPDDQRIVFSSSRHAGDKNPWIFTDVYIIDAEDGHSQRLTQTLDEGGFARAFSWDAEGIRGMWSPDGELQNVGTFGLVGDDYVPQPRDEPMGHGASCTPDMTEGSGSTGRGAP